MSHVVTIKTEFTDEKLLMEAASLCGLTRIDKDTYKWFGRHVGDYPMPEGFTAENLGKCDFALSVKGNETAYEIGVVKKEGKLVLLMDFWGANGKALESKIGKQGETLATEYSVLAAVTQMKREGMTLDRRWLDDQGATQLDFKPILH